jgi:hypothetical protein
MLRITWGGRILRASVALLVDLPPVRIILLGKVTLALPDPALPLVQLQATVLGVVDPSEPSLMLRASLAGSNIVGLPLSGEILLLTRGGSDPTFVLSAGGFHPRFVPPHGVPQLDRLGIDLSPTPAIDLRAQVYVAVTSNSIQFGARLGLDASVAGCGLHGHLGFDALFQRDPFRFVADASASIAVEVAGEELVGVHLDFSLEGPAPWRARGRGSVDLFLFSVSFSFDETWGAPPPTALEAPDVAGALAKAFAAREAWVLSLPDITASPVVLTGAARRALSAGEVLHPHGRLTARQKVVPLAVTLGRFNGLPISPQRWDVGDARLAADLPPVDASEVREQFAPGQFLALTDEDRLGRPAFESLRAGVEIIAGDVVTPEPRDSDLTFEVKVIEDDVTTGLGTAVVGRLRDVLTLGTALSASHPLWWQTPADRVTVSDGAPAPAIADAWQLTLATDVSLVPSATVTEAHEVTRRAAGFDPSRRLAVVEAWEVVA